MVNWRRFWRRLGIAFSLREPPILPAYAWSYFDHLAALYVTLNNADPRADEVIKKASEQPDDLTWGNIFLLENVIFSLQPPDVINRNAWIIRERFREMACPTVFEKYVASNVPVETDTPAKLSLLKADLSRILDVLHWHYSLIPMRERLRKSLTKYCIIYVVAYTAVLGILLHFLHVYRNDFAAMTACVVYWGIIGGFVSSQRRMESIPSDGDPLISVFGLDCADYYLWLSPLLGAIFAVILMLMFMAGILIGPVFPAFHSAVGPGRGGAMPPTEGISYFRFAWETLPTSGAEYAKLFLWAFLAGFAERLVPDSLDRLTARLTPGNKSNGARAPAVDPRTPPPAPGGSGGKHELTPQTLANVMHTGEIPLPVIGPPKDK
jgi:hypothetical protein